ncbi:MAG: NYN domain-containing protein [Candidatus Cloacimonetes bacterium]|nr:NYN domain-containing protein [Candidatus Cloacimonadota bacterium]
MDSTQLKKVGVYVDVSNVAMNGGYGMHYDVLREFACRSNGIAMRLNAYVPYDEERGRKDNDYYQKSNNFQSLLRDFGYKVIVKQVRWFVDEDGHQYSKSNADLDMAVDALLQSEKFDYVIMVTGDGDFVQVVRALQNKGCRVEVIGFKNVAHILKKEADSYVSGYLIPDLLPIEDNSENETKKWGDTGSRVRGVCYNYNSAKKFGFMRYIRSLGDGLWITDSRKTESPYQTAFFHKSELPENFDVNQLPNRDIIFEFDLSPSGKKDKGLLATKINLIHGI